MAGKKRRRPEPIEEKENEESPSDELKLITASPKKRDMKDIRKRRTIKKETPKNSDDEDEEEDDNEGVNPVTSILNDEASTLSHRFMLQDKLEFDPIKEDNSALNEPLSEQDMNIRVEKQIGEARKVTAEPVERVEEAEEAAEETPNKIEDKPEEIVEDSV